MIRATQTYVEVICPIPPPFDGARLTQLCVAVLSPLQGEVILATANDFVFETFFSEFLFTGALYMGAITDLLDNAVTDLGSGLIGAETQRFLTELASQPAGGTTIPAAYATKDTVQNILAYAETVSGGTFRLAFTLASGETFTTAAIAYNANAATIETAIDVAATAASVAGWTNGDISVTGGALTTANVVLTFDGDSVAAQNHGQTTINGTGLFINALGIAQQTAGNGTDTAEVQRLSTYIADPTGGTFNIAFSLMGDGPVTIVFDVDIPFDADAAEIETAIDAAAVAAGYAMWSGEIAVTASSTNLTDGTVDLTFGNGLLVQFANHALAVVDGSNLTGDRLEATPQTQTVIGQLDRYALAVLKTLGVIGDVTPPAPGATVPTVTAGANLASAGFPIPQRVIRDLAQEAGYADSNAALREAILALLPDNQGDGGLGQ